MAFQLFFLHLMFICPPRLQKTQKLHTGRLAVLLLVSVILSSAYTLWRTYSTAFIWGPWQEWGSLPNTVNTVLVFLLINSIHYRNHSRNFNRILALVSEITFGAYLLSWIPDTFFYPRLVAFVPELNKRFLLFPLMAAQTIAVSLALAFLVHLFDQRIQHMFSGALRRKVMENDPQQVEKQ